MHVNARLTPTGRLTMVLRIESGRPVAHVASEMGISRPTTYKWWRGGTNLWSEGAASASCPETSGTARGEPARGSCMLRKTSNGSHVSQEARRFETASLEDPARQIGSEWRAPGDRDLEYGD